MSRAEKSPIAIFDSPQHSANEFPAALPNIEQGADGEPSIPTISVHSTTPSQTALIESRTADTIDKPRVRAHIEGFELVRVLSALNVVTFHVLALTSGLIGRGSVCAFVMIAAALPAMQPDLGPFGRYARRRAARILTPWLIWSAVYGAVAGARYLRSGIVPPWNYNWLMIGTSIHLWFFVFIFFAGLGLWWTLHAVEGVSPSRAALGLTFCAAPLIVFYSQLTAVWEPPTPFGLWTICFPALLIGLALGLVCREEDARRTRGVILIASITLLAAVTAGLTGSVPILLSYGIPALLIPGALLLPIRVGPVIRGLASVSMGIYTTHPLVLIVLRHCCGETIPPAACVPIVFLSAAALAAMIRRFPGGTWLA